MLTLIKLPDLGDRYPYQLSGGQQQRVALARALAPKPKVLLLDEPLSALDAKIRVSLREEIRAIQSKLGITTIYVTHDQEEALSMSDRIVVMNGGRAEQVGTPFEIYNRPRDALRRLVRRHAQHARGTVIDPATGRVRVDGQEILAARAIPQAAGSVCTLALRPEAAVLEGKGAAGMPGEGRNRLQAFIDEVSFLGSVVRIRVRLQDVTLSLDTFNDPGEAPPNRGAPAVVTFASRDLLVLDATDPG